ncbi:carboxymuconolactone decarboxylase family protein [Acidocella sp.]|uniref:carboxymuconolactone decarboxylase family protein n=1 Tax=Acidocella sp. TaxID=50710 RepID=UPI00263A067A|nr:hypothetical protein [Acidocella sp.]
MTRVTAVYKPADYPGTPEQAATAGVAELFGYLFPGKENPEIDAAHLGVAVTARNPMLALNLARMSGFVARDLGWCQDQKLHELAVQAVNQHFGCAYTLRARAARAASLGLGPDVLAAIPDGGASPVFSETERLVVTYARAVASGNVPAVLFAEVAARFGETGAVECTAAIAWWGMWAMIINALCPDGA